jgi:hypothetical protein
MDSGEFREINEIETKRRDRWVLPEALRRFLDNRDTPSFSALMLLVDHLRHRRMLEPDEILTRLYRATAGTLDSRDKRYRRLEDPSHCAWAALLLASENSFIKGNAFVSMDYVGQRYGRAAASPAWFASNDGWQTIAPLLEIGALEKLSRLVNARLELQRTLRRRLEAMESSDIAWFHSLIRSSDGPRAAESSNGQPPVVIAEAD